MTTSTDSLNYQPTNHRIIVGGANSTINSLAAGNSGQILRSAGSAADPAYSTATYPATAGTSSNVLTSDGTNWISSAAPGGAMLTISGTLTNSQIKNLHGTPVQAIAAPGSGNVIEVIHFISTMNYGGTNVFTAGAGQTINLYYGTAISLAVAQSNAAIVSASSQVSSGSVAFSGQPLSSATNTAVNFYNSSATEISGNAANNNTISYVIAYKITTIP